MKMHFSIKNLLLIALCSFLAGKSAAQADTIRQHLYNINTFYDSAGSMAFDVRFVYDSDTVLGNYQHRENEGSFIMDKNRFYYKLDFTECIQSDSFLLTIYSPEQMIMVSPPTTFASGGVIPLRNKIDSLLQTEFANYSYAIFQSDTMNVIRFTSIDSLTEFKSFALHYDPENFALKQYEISFDYYAEADSSELGELIRSRPGVPRELTLRVYFLNYRVETLSESIFDLDNYIKADGMEAWKGIGKYTDYTVSKFSR